MPDNANCPPSRFAALTRIHAHAARIGRTGPAPLILPQVRV